MSAAKRNSSALWYLLLMGMFGCLGPVVRAIGLPTVLTASLRAWISTLSLIPFMLISGRRIRKESFRRTILPMMICGVLIFGDWFGLFMAYEYTTIATATVCYYIVPMLVLIGSAVFLHERFTLKHCICALVAFTGMIFVSGIISEGPMATDIRGPLYALIGAFSYATVVLINKRYPDGDPVVRTAIQLAVVAVMTTPYVCITTDWSEIHITPETIVLLLLFGVVMTAAAYIAYFSLILRISSRTVAIFAYADPVVAVFVSVFFMREAITWQGILGSVMIIGAAVISETGKN